MKLQAKLWQATGLMEVLKISTDQRNANVILPNQKKTKPERTRGEGRAQVELQADNLKIFKRGRKTM